MAKPYIANEIILELDLTGKTGADGTTGGKVQVECWIQSYTITKDTTSNSTVDVTTMCPSGLYTLVSKSSGGGYVLSLDYVNDWLTTGTAANANSLSWVLVKFPNATNVPFKLIDRAGGSTGITITGTISSLPDFAVGGHAGHLARSPPRVRSPRPTWPQPTRSASPPARSGRPGSTCSPPRRTRSVGTERSSSQARRPKPDRDARRTVPIPRPPAGVALQTR